MVDVAQTPTLGYMELVQQRDARTLLPIVQQPKVIYLAKPVSSDKVFFSADYISFVCI